MYGQITNIIYLPFWWFYKYTSELLVQINGRLIITRQWCANFPCRAHLRRTSIAIHNIVQYRYTYIYIYYLPIWMSSILTIIGNVHLYYTIAVVLGFFFFSSVCCHFFFLHSPALRYEKYKYKNTVCGIRVLGAQVQVQVYKISFI